ncbi:unnamed protein product [Eruca vesicaria subsp. sativa]|uniref:Protein DETOXIFICATION n=1 Tax=Eruca vesicaria subsp. sativa TaxID=29727 RepID=A0ABC8IXB5_ERUVS|nr:unnamed protein product [Eruca vesicaria subsp. sativa]
MEEGFSLVPKEDEEEKQYRNEKSADQTSYLSTEMMKKVSSLAAPMVAVAVSQYLLQVISIVMAGHLDAISLSGVAIATSLTNVTGFSLLFGLAGALETLCGQAFGAEQFRKISSYTYGSMLCLLLFCLPISFLWVFMDKLLELFHQDPLISQLACKYSIWLIPALFGFSVLQSLTRYFQSQGLVLPLFLSSFVALCFHIPFCWLLVYKLRFGIVGAALSIGLSYWMNVGLLWVFMRNSSLHRQTKNLRAQEIFLCMKQFIALAIPSAMMTCLEWWSFELLVLLSGLLPNSKLETSVLSICLTMSSLHYVLVNAIGASASTHVSNELGAGNPKEARAAAISALFLGAIDATIVSITLYTYRGNWAYIFSNESEVAHYATQITPILCLSIGVDSFLAVLSGVARGTGWQHIGAYANIGSYYLAGIPLGSFLCFVVKLRGKGLWIGVLIGSTLQTIVLALVTFFTSWEQEAAKARDRVIEVKPQDNQELQSILQEDVQVLLKDVSENS